MKYKEELQSVFLYNGWTFSLPSFAMEGLCKAVQAITLFSDTLLITTKACFNFLAMNSYRVPKDEYKVLPLLTYANSYPGGEGSGALYF